MKSGQIDIYEHLIIIYNILKPQLKKFIIFPTGIGTAFSLLGIAGSYLLGPLVVHTEPPSPGLSRLLKLYPEEYSAETGCIDDLRSMIRREIRQFMLICKFL